MNDCKILRRNYPTVAMYEWWVWDYTLNISVPGTYHRCDNRKARNRQSLAFSRSTGILITKNR